MTRKVCNGCNQEKSTEEFGKNRARPDGLSRKCKPCDLKRVKDYYRTIKGTVTRMYNSQKNSSKYRGHSLPNYTKGEFKNWLLSQPNFQQLYDNWEKANYARDLSPSCDRLDDYTPYRLDNLRLVTWRDNIESLREDQKTGKHTKRSKGVNQLSEDKVFIKQHCSINQAARDIGTTPGMVHYGVKTGRKASGFFWEYSC